MNPKLKAFNKITSRWKPSPTREASQPKLDELIKLIETTIIPSNELSKLSAIQGKQQCFNQFLEICFQYSIFFYSKWVGQDFEIYTSMMKKETLMAHYRPDDTSKSQGVVRAKVYFHYLKLVTINPFRDWMGDIYMEMVTQYVLNKHNNTAYFPTPYDVNSLIAQIIHVNLPNTENQEIIPFFEACCGTAGMALQCLKQHNQDGDLAKMEVHLSDIDETMTKIATVQCVSVMMNEATPFRLKITHQNDLTNAYYGTAFSNIGLPNT